MDKEEEKGKKENNLMFEKKFAFDVWDDAMTKKCFDFCEGYKEFLSACKTERKTAETVQNIAAADGFVPLEHIDSGNDDKIAARKVYSINRGKSIVLAKRGKKPIKNGARIILAHIDSPRLDLKVRPIFESEHLAFLKTHYYGGIKKYQWTALPLSVHGKIIKENGEAVDISIGEDPGDPIFMITDLLPHLSKNQLEKKLEDAINAESLNVVSAGMGTKNKDDKDPVKKNLLKLLNQK